MNNGPQKPTSRFIEVPDWNEYPSSLRPAAKLIFVLLFPLIACLRIGATLWAGAMFLAMALSFFFVVVSMGPIAMVVVVIITIIAARWTFQSEGQKSPGHLRGRPVERRDSAASNTPVGRGRSLVRRSARSDGNSGEQR